MSLSWIDPTTLTYTKLCLLVVTYESIQNPPKVIEARLAELRAEVDRRMQWAA